MVAMDVQALMQRTKDTEIKINKASQQIRIIDRGLRILNDKIGTAARNNNQVMIYNLQLRIMTVEGVRSAFVSYMRQKSEEIIEMLIQIELGGTTTETDEEDEATG
jgi:hypothetical protein